MGSIFFTILVGFIVVGGTFYLVGIYNHLVQVKNDVNKAWANIDVLLKQRHDELPKLIKTCEAYMQYEKETLAKIIALRNSAQNETRIAARAEKEGELTGILHKLFALAENYPDLKAQANFQNLQKRISDLENEIADRREFYNESVNNLNIRIESMPDSFIASLMHLSQKEMYKISETDRQDVEINIKTPE